MDISKFKIPTLDGPNWGLWSNHIQSTTRILDIWDVIGGEILTTNPITRDLLEKLSQPATNATAAEIAVYTTAKAIWSKKNAQCLGLIQATVSNVIWQKHQSLGTAKLVFNALETKFGAAGGAQTYLQLVNMVKIQFTNSMDLLPQIRGFQDNYNLITSNGQSRLSEDLATFMFCLSLPDSYELTAWKYLDNIMSITNYKLLDLIARVLQEENRWKALAIGQGLSLNRFSTMKNIRQKCAKCGKTNHTTQNHWSRGKNLNKKGKGQSKSKKLSDLSGKKKTDKKGKGKEKAPVSANVLTVLDLADLSIQMAQSIDFSCYKTSEKVEWCLDSGCTDHITPSKSNFVQYQELGQASKAEIADGKYLKIEGYGTVIG